MINKLAQVIVEKLRRELDAPRVAIPESGFLVTQIDNGLLVREVNHMLGGNSRVMYCKDITEVGSTLVTMLAARKVLGEHVSSPAKIITGGAWSGASLP
jgi:hypothetical protein